MEETKVADRAGDSVMTPPEAVTTRSGFRLRLSRVMAGCVLTLLAGVVAGMALAAFRGIRDLERPTGWAAGELLINYEGGFVRRGLFGQVFRQSEHPLRLATHVQKWVVAAFLTGSTLIVWFWKRLPAALAYVILIGLAPGGLLHLAAAGGFAYLDRKEIWFYAALAGLVCAAKTVGLYRITSAAVTGLLAAVMILHHEAFAVFYVPPVVFCFLAYAIKAHGKPALIQLLLIMLPPSLAFAAVVLNAGDAATARAIAASYAGTDAANAGGGISAIGWSFNTSNALSARVLSEGSRLYWLIHFAAAVALAGLCVAFTPYNRAGRRLAWCVLLWHMFATVLLAYAGWDWGRWISMFTIGSALMLALVHVLTGHTAFGPHDGPGFWTGARDAGPRSFNAPLLFVMALPAILIGTLSRMASYGPQAGRLTLSTDMWTALFRAFR